LIKFYTELDAKLQEFIAEQKIFFVGTADTDGCVNLSPKGMNVQNLVFARLNIW
jgi:predicted pyridoxine 5'-phosphate oxidase superfamily flavin-nucleotide-binding protein